MTGQPPSAVPEGAAASGQQASSADGQWHRTHPLSPVIRLWQVIVVVLYFLVQDVGQGMAQGEGGLPVQGDGAGFGGRSVAFGTLGLFLVLLVGGLLSGISWRITAKKRSFDVIAFIRSSVQVSSCARGAEWRRPDPFCTLNGSPSWGTTTARAAASLLQWHAIVLGSTHNRRKGGKRCIWTDVGAIAEHKAPAWSHRLEAFACSRIDFCRAAVLHQHRVEVAPEQAA